MQQIARTNVEHSQLARIQKDTKGKLAEEKQLFPSFFHPFNLTSQTKVPLGLTLAMKAKINYKWKTCESCG